MAAKRKRKQSVYPDEIYVQYMDGDLIVWENMDDLTENAGPVAIYTLKATGSLHVERSIQDEFVEIA